MTGKVWLVGAGPGDMGLLTIKGEQVLKQADVVVYDALVGQGVLNLIPDSAELIFAGKRSGNHYLKQEETNLILLEEAKKGKKVVRLKGGDPFVFGRGGEELELLVESNIPFEIVPGVTSAFSVPAYNGIPVTHRDYCSSVHIITGHKRKDSTYDIDFKALVNTKGTLVFLMGISALTDICNGLINAGMDKDMPAAVLEKGTTSAQRKTVATVSTLESECLKNNVQTPAIIVVGEVCTLSDTFNWFYKKPLSDVKVVVTRPKELVSGLSDMLRKEGAEVLELPSICTKAVKDDRNVIKSIQNLENKKFDWVVFTSPSGVRIFFEKLMKISDVRAFSNVKIAVIGQGTKKALLNYGLKADFIPSVYDGATLGRELAHVCKPNDRILIPRAAIGNKELTDELKTFDVTDIATYDTEYVKSRLIDIKQEIENNEITFAVFTSASTVKGFVNSIGEMDFKMVRAVCIGKQTKAAAESYGMQTFVSEKATLESLVECVKKAKGER